MAFNNSCFFVGRIAEPNVREINKNDGTTTVKVDVGLAVQDGYGKNSGTNWVNLEVWGKLAEVVRDYAPKGSKIGVRAEYKVDSYEKDGEKKTKTVFVVRDLELLNTKNESDSLRSNSSQAEKYSEPEVALDDDELPPF